MVFDRRRLRRCKAGWKFAQPLTYTGGDPDSWTSINPHPAAGVSGAVASGFLLSHNRMMTAGHCVKGGNCFTSSLEPDELAFVFDLTEVWFRSASMPDLSDSQVYFGSRLLAGEFNARFMDIPDWAVVELECPLAPSRDCHLSAGNQSVDQQVKLVGHPNGRLQSCWSGRLINCTPVDHEPYYLLQAPALPGASGSLVSDCDGRLLGLLAGTASDAAIDKLGGRERVNDPFPLGRVTPSVIFQEFLRE